MDEVNQVASKWRRSTDGWRIPHFRSVDCCLCLLFSTDFLPWEVYLASVFGVCVCFL